MAFVVCMTHRRTGERRYLGTVPLGPVASEPEELERLQKLASSVTEIHDSEGKLFHTLDEAKNYGFPSAEIAMAVLSLLPETMNLDFEVIDITEK